MKVIVLLVEITLLRAHTSTIAPFKTNSGMHYGGDVQRALLRTGAQKRIGQQKSRKMKA